MALMGPTEKKEATEWMGKTVRMPAIAKMVETMVMTEQMMPMEPLVKVVQTVTTVMTEQMMLTKSLVKVDQTETMVMMEQMMLTESPVNIDVLDVCQVQRHGWTRKE